jgi:hypothetical protein
VNAETEVFATGSFSSPGMSTPMRRTRSPCCARATTGHAAALPSPAMNCRRRIRDPSRWISEPYHNDGCRERWFALVPTFAALR